MHPRTSEELSFLYQQLPPALPQLVWVLPPLLLPLLDLGAAVVPHSGGLPSPVR